ncbi:outer membrane autotransporter [Glycocaulis alkaliphilus]|uniref:Outer membrane autotransporter n=1 Tax=Glycocaulis alkaliphilus TaxID=1434191 RepID=A0A3T0E9W8_9PROT|nr:autotransporter outer membrane beta-barrel domain-containing protein [Glycocaulis alkaliphilus]AZU04245.1 outer membrane autotransporter [Glycocaulis alkaliphilus]GGB76949.1 autotransporter protein [Glycocaulis alkaliphilus]
MRRRLLTAASLVALCSSPVWADEEISSERTSPVRTSDAGDIVITSSGRVTLTGNSGPAVVIDSDNSVETRSGSSITIADQSNATGIFLEGGRTGSLSHGGVIQLTDESLSLNTALNEPLGALTEETNKTGILVGAAGEPAFVGDVTVTGGVAVVGQNSYGVRVVSGIDGNLNLGGTISVTGENSTVVSVEGPVSGDVVVRNVSNINATGAGSTALAVNADIGGGVRISGPLQANGYRISDRTLREVFQALAENGSPIAEDQRQSGPVVVIAGSVVDGVFIAGGQDGATAGIINGLGSAPSLVVQTAAGATGPLTLGEVVYEEADTSEDAEEGDTVTTNRGFGLVNDGNIRANGVFDGVSSTAILIAGRDVNGTVQAAILGAGGFENTGSVVSVAYDAHTTAVHLGDGAQMAGFTNSGSVFATSARGFDDDGFADNAFGTGSATAIHIESGVLIDRIDNTGTIRGRVNTGGVAATGIHIENNTLQTITNTGTIAADAVDLADSANPVLTAIDARNMTAGLTITQSAATGENAVAPAIAGDIRFGSGDDTLDIQAGTVTGDIYFGAGADNLILRNATLTGAINSGDGQLTIDVENSNLELGLTNQVNITSARFGDGAVLNLVLDRNTSANASVSASGEISFEHGSELVVSLSELVGAAQTYQVLSAGTLNIADEAVILEAVDTPFIYSATLERDAGDPNSLVLSLERKTAEQIGFDPNRAAVYDAALSLFDDVSSLGNAIASIRDADAFYSAYDQLLPEYAASAIQFALASHDAAAGALSTRLRNARLSPSELAGLWIQEFGYYADRTGSALGPGYRGYGVGLAVGIDRPLGPFYAVGMSLAGAASEIEQIGLNHDPMTTLMGQVSGYAAIDFGGIDASFTASAGINRFETQRNIGIGSYTGSTSADWGGWHYSLSAQAGRDIPLGNWIVRPEASLTWLSISEDGFNEIALDNTAPELALFVDSRTTSALTGGATVTVARMFQRSGSWWMPYARVGYRGDFSGNSGETTARFGENGTPFTLRAADLPSAGLLAGLGFSGGSNYTTFTFAYDADYRDDYVNHVLRLVLRMNF